MEVKVINEGNNVSNNTILYGISKVIEGLKSGKITIEDIDKLYPEEVKNIYTGAFTYTLKNGVDASVDTYTKDDEPDSLLMLFTIFVKELAEENGSGFLNDFIQRKIKEFNKGE